MVKQIRLHAGSLKINRSSDGIHDLAQSGPGFYGLHDGLDTIFLRPFPCLALQCSERPLNAFLGAVLLVINYLLNSLLLPLVAMPENAYLRGIALIAK